MKNITFMKKYTDSKVPIEIDPSANQYKITIPEWVVNEFDWYDCLLYTSPSPRD